VRAVHAVWGPDASLHIWAEDAEAYEKLGRRAPRVRVRQDHPFAMTARDLPAVVDAVAPNVPSKPARLGIVLAGRQDAPDPSPGLPVTPRGRSGDTASASWYVASRKFEGGALLDLLVALAARPAAEFDASVTALTRLLRLALELVARGRFLPSLRSTSGTAIEARWIAAPGAADLVRIAAAERSMPGSIRCAITSTGATISRATVTAEVLDELVDAYVGRALEPRVPSLRWMYPAWRAKLLASFATSARRRIASSEHSRDLAVALDGWREAVRPADAPLRTVFRLYEPPEAEPEERARAETAQVAPLAERPQAEVPEDAPPETAQPGLSSVGVVATGLPESGLWRLEVLLGARDDPSLLVAATDVWRGRSPLARLTRTHPQDVLLADLGRASRLFPPLEEALRTARPAGIELDTEAAHLFLAEGAPALAEAGFGVMVPGWWRQRHRRLGLRLRTRKSAQSKTSVARIGLEALLAYDWQVAIGDAAMTADELHRLAALKAPLVRVRGEWVELAPDQISAALHALERPNTGTMTVAQAMRTALGLEAAPGGLEVLSVAADEGSPLKALLDGDFGNRSGPLPTPAGFGGALRPYQERGLGWLALNDEIGFGVCLADDMGLGKTPQLLALLLEARRPGGAPGSARDETPGPTLLVCPMSVVGNWQREAARFAPELQVHVHHGAGRLTADALAEAAGRADLVITTYAVAARDRAHLARVAWRRVVLDEAQAIKNAETAQSKAVRSLDAKSRVALTGTPVENRLTELWSIMDFLNPGLLGSQRRFRERFAAPIEVDHDQEAADRLRRLTGPFILRRLKSDRSIVPDLPDKIEITVPCNLTREQATLYQATVDEMLRRIEEADGEGDENARRGNVLAAMTRLKQVCNHPAHLLADGSALAGRSGKLAQLEVILDDVLTEGDRALIFTQFTEWADQLRPYLRDRFGREVLYLHGGTPKVRRDEMVERFQSGAAPIFLLSLRAGGTGLNLTAANHVIHFDRWWNPAVEDQASDRAYRIGQTRNVQVRALVCAGTIEERIAEVMAAKRDVAGRVIGSGERWLTDLSTPDLRRLLALSSDSVAELD
jgi:non-specific serine/threonine protein kinase